MATRGVSFKSAISPKNSPEPKVTAPSFNITDNAPDEMKNILSPASPSLQITSPGITNRAWSRFAIDCRFSASIFSNSGTAETNSRRLRPRSNSGSSEAFCSLFLRSVSKLVKISVLIIASSYNSLYLDSS